MTQKNTHAGKIKIKQDKAQLVSRFLRGEAPDFLREHTRLLDTYFCESYKNSNTVLQLVAADNPFAIVALGGYGREEQCIHSDVDLIFLFKKKVPESAETLVEEMLYPLWDIRLDIGHGTRSVKDCLTLAKSDVTVLLSLMDARFIAGVSEPYTVLMDELIEKMLPGQANPVMNWIFESSQQRHEHFGDSAYLLEPNLKEGPGGLRDYHAMRWVAQIRSHLKELEDFEYHGYLSHEEMNRFKEALHFIWHVRNHLHQLAHRKCDQLYFDHQIQLANMLKFERADGQEPVERFLSQLHRQMEFVKQQHLMFFYELGYIKPLNATKTSRKQTRVEGLVIQKGGMLNFTCPEVILEKPELLLSIFEESTRLQIPLGAEAKRLVKEFNYLLDNTCKTDASMIRSFERILVSPEPAFNVMEEMLNTGLLAKLIPEMQDIQDRIQYNEYHIYPVDRHSLRTVQAIKAFDTPEQKEKESLYARLFKELQHPNLLLWSALLHDIGKGAPDGDHAQKGAIMVQHILGRFGFEEKEKNTVSFLVREHLLLAKTATRRDINEEETAISCARTIEDPERLKMLYLLTVADSQATGPKAWNDWTSTLLNAFFLKLLNILEKGELVSRETVKAIESKKARVWSTAFSPEIEKDLGTLMSVMSPRYFLYVPAKDMVDHIRLYHKLKERNFVWDITQSDILNTRTVTICAKDRPGLFSKIAGVFTLNNINILHAQVFTWRNNIALDIFEVTPPPDQIFEKERWQRAEETLASSLTGEMNLETALKEKISYRPSVKSHTRMKPPRVNIDNDSSSYYTIIDVFTYDFPGLLYRITDVLYKCELDIWIAKIATQVDQVVDVFYVRDYSSQKVDAPDKVASIKAAIEKVIVRS